MCTARSMHARVIRSRDSATARVSGTEDRGAAVPSGRQQCSSRVRVLLLMWCWMKRRSSLPSQSENRCCTVSPAERTSLGVNTKHRESAAYARVKQASGSIITTEQQQTPEIRTSSGEHNKTTSAQHRHTAADVALALSK